MNKLISGINSLMQEFGFKTGTDYISSTFGFCWKKSIMIMGLSFGALGAQVESFIGLDPIVYLAFLVLLFLEFRTGIKASIKDNVKIQSKRIGRVILKMLTYTLIIGIINIFKTKLFIPKILGFEVNIYSVIYYTVLNLIIFQLLLSVFENLSRLGYKESSKIFLILTKKIDKWFTLDKSEFDKSKSDIDIN